MSSEVEFQELGKDYIRSLEILNDRIKEINSEIKSLEMSITNKEDRMKNYEIELRIDDIKDRLKPLLEMQRDVREAGKEVLNYYNRSWWRSEKYTINTRKSRFSPVSFRNVFECRIIDKLCSDTENEKNNV